MSTVTIKELTEKYLINTYGERPVAFVRGSGTSVWDAEGNEYLDLYGGHCVVSIGHCHPGWVEAIAAQASSLGFYSNVVSNDTRAAFQRRLVDFAPEPMAADWRSGEPQTTGRPADRPSSPAARAGSSPTTSVERRRSGSFSRSRPTRRRSWGS